MYKTVISLLSLLLLIISIDVIAQNKLHTNDIINYISTNENKFIKDYEIAVNDSIYSDVYFQTADFGKNTNNKIDINSDIIDENLLAYNEIYNGSCEITIDNRERYKGLDYRESSNKNIYNENDYFLYSVIFHEITHCYFAQVILEISSIKHLKVNEYYKQQINIYPKPELRFPDFIEEGFCEYICRKYDLEPQISVEKQQEIIEEILELNKIGLSKVNKLSNKFNHKLPYDILYLYSSQYLKDFLDGYPKPKDGLEKILSNEPPTIEEICNPKLYYNRLRNIDLNSNNN